MARWHYVILLALCIAFAACSSGPNEPIPADIVVTPGAVVIAQLQTQLLSVSVVDEAGALLSGIAVTFEVADETIATVSNIGLVTSAGPAGVTQVVVHAGELSKQISVAVTPVSKRISITPNPAVVPQNGTLQLDARLLDVTGTPVPGAVLTFTSGTPSIAQVSQTGLVTPVGPAGQVTITVASDTITGQVALAVTQVPTALIAAPDPITIGHGGALRVQATVRDAVGAPIVDAPVTFEASPATLLTVSSSGMLTAADAIGTGTVTIRSDTLERTVPVTVTATTHPQGVLAATTPTGISQPYGVALAGDGRIAVGGLTGGLAFGRLPSFALSTNQLSGQITAVTFSAGGRLFASGAPGDGVSEVDPATGVALGSVSGLEGTPFDLIVSPDEQTLYVGTSAGWVYFIDIATRSVVHQVQVGGALVHLALHPSQPLLYASPQSSPTVFEINTETRAQRPVTTGLSQPQAVAVSLDGATLYVADEGGTLGVVTIATGASTLIPLGCGGYGMAQTPDGAQLYVSCSLAGQVMIIDELTRGIIGSIATAGAPRRVAVSPDGQTVAIANEGGWVDFIQ